MTGKTKSIVIYTKYCLKCLHPEEFRNVVLWKTKNNVKVNLRRTTYNPLWHKLATKKYGTPDYPDFVIAKRKVIDFMDFAKDCKNKLAPEGAKKEVAHDLPTVQPTKNVARKNSVLRQNTEAGQKNGQKS